MPGWLPGTCSRRRYLPSMGIMGVMGRNVTEKGAPWISSPCHLDTQHAQVKRESSDEVYHVPCAEGGEIGKGFL